MKATFEHAAQVAIANYAGKDPSFASRIRFFADYFGQREVDQILAEDIEDALDALAQRGKIHIKTTRQGVEHRASGKPLAPATRNRYLAALGSMYRILRTLRLLPRGFVSPTRGVEREMGDNSRTVSVTVDDVRRLVAACRLTSNRQLAAITATACTTGWRLGSLQAVTWSQIDLTHGHADIQTTKNGTPHRAVLLPWVIEELKRIRPAGAKPGDLVFGKRQFRKSWARALELANLPPEWTFHHTRHIAASILAQSGASVPTIMQALNHKSPSMAMRYSHLNVASLRENLSRAWA